MRFPSSVLKQLVWSLSLTFPMAVRATDLCGDPQLKQKPEVLQLVCAGLKAVNDSDAAALRRLIADDFGGMTAGGKYFGNSKEKTIARWTEPASPGSSGRSALIALYRVVQTRDSGFVSGTIEDRTLESGVAHCSVHAFTDTWLRRKGRWQWVHAQESGVQDVGCTP